MGLSITHLIIVLLVILIIFGAGKLPKVMGDLGRGIRNFRDGLKSEEAEPEHKSRPKRLKHDKK